MKKRFGLKLLLLSPILVAVIVINVVADPANLFAGSKYERGVANLLLQGVNVADISNYDERLLQKDYVNGLTSSKDIIVLGSSRSMVIRADLFDGQSFFNNSVSGASLEDDLAIYELYRQKNIKPSTVILALDPWLLNRQNGQTRWRSLAGEYQAAARRYNQTHRRQLPSLPYASQLVKFAEAVSPAYLQQSVKALWYHTRPAEYKATKDEEAESQIKRWDGAISYDRKTMTLTADEVRQLAISYVEQVPVYSLDKFVTLDNDYESLLNAFLDSLQKEGVQVVILLAPYHPEAYRRLMASDKYRIIEPVQRYFEQLARGRNLPLLGSYNPADCGCDENDFYDGMHPKEGCIKKIFDNGDKKFTGKALLHP